jgi:hypothetical protein
MNQVTVNGNQIIWDTETRSAIAEASALGLRPGEWPATINAVSHKTGNVRTWKHSHVDEYDNHRYKMTTAQGTSNEWPLIVCND